LKLAIQNVFYIKGLSINLNSLCALGMTSAHDLAKHVATNN